MTLVFKEEVLVCSRFWASSGPRILSVRRSCGIVLLPMRLSLCVYFFLPPLASDISAVAFRWYPTVSKIRPFTCRVEAGIQGEALHEPLCEAFARIRAVGPLRNLRAVQLRLQ